MRKYFLIPFIVLFGSCTTAEKAGQSSEAKTNDENSSETKSGIISENNSSKDDVKKKSELNEKNTYRLVVSFYSTGSGSDSKSIDMFENFLADYSVQHNLRLAFDKTPWGREGEVDYCVRLDNLNFEAQKNFVLQTREILFQTQLVYITENAACRHKR